MKKNPACKRITLVVAGMTTLALAAHRAYAQVIAYDAATNSAYAGGDFDTGYNGGYGLGSWTLNTPGGGHYVGNDGGTTWFGLWNNGVEPGSYSHATRSFNASLSVGQAFSTSFKTGNLTSSYEQEGFSLQDSSGNTLFSYWQQGGNNSNGNYLDANGSGTASGFAYNYNTLNGFEFVLDSATTYTFTDLANSASFSGTIAGSIDQVQYFRQSLAGDPSNGGGGGTDFRFYDLSITVVPEPATLAIAGLGGLGLLLVTRRRSV